MNEFTISCPAPYADNQMVQMAHGSGGKIMHRLLNSLFLPAFANPGLDAAHDGAALHIAGAHLAFTTDSYVVNPLFFPGGDIGKLAVYGTVNDLAMCGARPLFLSAGFILEEGLPLDVLKRVVQSMQEAAQAAGVQIVTGDTKVVDKGKGDGLFINTAGIGLIVHAGEIAPQQVCAGDAVIVSGDLGRHGMAVMAQREGLSFESLIESDCAPLTGPVMALLDADIEVHCLRDLTRGGLVSALCEISEAAEVQIDIVEADIPVLDDVRGACEILGLDPLYVANEGRFVAFVAPEDAARACLIMGDDARRIGTVQAGPEALVRLRSSLGPSRILDMLSGEQLPRIC